MTINGGKLFLIEVDPALRWAWISFLPDRATPWESRNVPLGKWFREIMW